MKTKTATKALNAVIIKAKKVKDPISKVEIVPPSTDRSISEVKKNTISRLTKEMLKKRQDSKGTVRKKGGADIVELAEKKIKTLSKEIEAAPTKAE